MMKEEFEEIIGTTVTKEEYDAIEFVYMWHPAIKNSGGKQQIATIYVAGGMAVINDMCKRAILCKDIEEMISKSRARMDFLQDKKIELLHCHNVDEFEIEFKSQEVNKRE